MSVMTDQKKYHYAALAHLAIKKAMKDDRPITYGQLAREIDCPWPVRGNEFSDVLGLVTIVDRRVAEYVTLAKTGRTSERQRLFSWLTHESYREHVNGWGV